MRYKPPIKGKIINTPSQEPKIERNLSNSIGGIVNLVNELKSVRDDLMQSVDDKLKEVDTVIEQVKEIKKGEDGNDGVDADEQSIIDTVLSKIPVPKDGKNADEEKIISVVLSKLPDPQVIDENKIVKRVIGLLPDKKADLKIIQENIEIDPMSVIDKIMALPEEKRSKLQLGTSNISGLDQTMSAFRNQLGRGYLHGGGLSEVIHDATLTGKGTTASPLSVVTTASGINSINTDFTANQFLVTGTSGTDFAIADNGTGTHTFNLPTASSLNRGALSSADWTTFNNKLGNSLAEGHFLVGSALGVATDAGTGIIWAAAFKNLTLNSTGSGAIPLVVTSAGNTTFGVTSSAGQAIMNLLPSGTADSFVTYKTRLVLGSNGGLGGVITNYFELDSTGLTSGDLTSAGNGSIFSFKDSTQSFTWNKSVVLSGILNSAWGTTVDLSAGLAGVYEIEFTSGTGNAIVLLPTGTNAVIGTEVIVGAATPRLTAGDTITMNAGTGNLILFTIGGGTSSQTAVMDATMSEYSAIIIRKISATTWRMIGY